MVLTLLLGLSTHAHALTIHPERYVLPNGMVVILHEDHRLPKVVVEVSYRVGSKDERKGRTGFAHLFEHLMFMGTKNVPNGGFDTIMEAAGGQNNAATSEDRTFYFETGPSNLLETFLWLESDRLSTLADDMNQKKLDLQRDVVKNERRQSYENRPYGQIELLLPEKLYPEGHPYHHPVIGSHADLTAAKVDDVKAFFRSYYVPSNAALIVSGDFRSDETKKLVEKYFGWMKKKPEPAHSEPKLPPPLSKTETVALKDAVELPKVMYAYHSPEWFGPGETETELLSAVLGGGKSSRLYRTLVYDKKLAESVEVGEMANRYAGIFAISAIAQKGHSTAELTRAIDEELAKLKSQPPTAEEVTRARAYLEIQHMREIEPDVGLAEALAQFEFRFADPSRVGELLSRYEKIGAKEVALQADRVLSQPHVVFQVEPK